MKKGLTILAIILTTTAIGYAYFTKKNEINSIWKTDELNRVYVQ